MKIEKFVDFYLKCKNAGFVKLIHDEKSNGALSIVAPVKGGIGSVQVVTFEEDDMDFYSSIKPICWISNTHSNELLDKLNAFIVKSKLKQQYKRHEEEEIKYKLEIKGNFAKITSFTDSIKKLRTIKVRMFTVNENKN